MLTTFPLYALSTSLTAATASIQSNINRSFSNFNTILETNTSDITQLQTDLSGKASTTNVYTIAAADLQFTTKALYNALVTAVG